MSTIATNHVNCIHKIAMVVVSIFLVLLRCANALCKCGESQGSGGQGSVV